MKKLIALPVLLILTMLISIVGFTHQNVTARPNSATSPGLGVASSFSVLAETLISNIPTSSISGDVGLSPATGAGIGLTSPEVGGTIYAVDEAGPADSVNDPALLTNAINAMMGTFIDLDQPCTTTFAGVQDLTTVSPLVEGVYCADAFLLTGNLTLSGSGVWIFKSAATLTTSVGSSITGGDPCNVWWRLVSAADLGANSSMIGIILAGTSINMQSGASLNGQALAQAAVTLSANSITGPGCVSPPTATDTIDTEATITVSPVSATGTTGPVNTAGPENTTSPVSTGTTPSASELPSSGGAPLWTQGFLWALVIIGGLSAAVFLIRRNKSRNIFRSK